MKWQPLRKESWRLLFQVRTEKSIRRNGKMKKVLLHLWNEEEGQDLTEYALLLVLLSLAAVASLGSLATAINGVFSQAVTNLT
jgi:Flp pilus assembly pilin Flp